MNADPMQSATQLQRVEALYRVIGFNNADTAQFCVRMFEREFNTLAAHPAYAGDDKGLLEDAFVGGGELVLWSVDADALDPLIECVERVAANMIGDVWLEWPCDDPELTLTAQEILQLTAAQLLAFDVHVWRWVCAPDMHRGWFVRSCDAAAMQTQAAALGFAVERIR